MCRRLRYVLRLLRRIPPATRGKARVARALLGPCLGARNVTVDALGGVKFLVPSLREPIAFHLLIDGVYESEALEFVLNRLGSGGVFVDVGASVGSFAIPAARKVGPGGRVIATEASPRVLPFLETNITLNGVSNVRLVRGASYGTSGGDIPFFEAPAEHFGMGSLGAQFNAAPVMVPAHTLDEVVAQAGVHQFDVMKVDVEGFERQVFAGASRILTGERPPVVVFEFCDWAERRLADGGPGDAQRLLKDFGYSIWRLRDAVRSRAPLEGVLTAGFETLVAIRPGGGGTPGWR